MSQQPNVSTVVGGTNALQQGIRSNLMNQGGAPDISQLVRQVGQNMGTQNQIMQGPQQSGFGSVMSGPAEEQRFFGAQWPAIQQQQDQYRQWQAGGSQGPPPGMMVNPQYDPNFVDTRGQVPGHPGISTGMAFAMLPQQEKYIPIGGGTGSSPGMGSTGMGGRTGK